MLLLTPLRCFFDIDDVVWYYCRMLFLVILVFALFASIFTLSKEALNYAEPFFFIGTRMGMAGILLLSHQWIFNKEAFKNIKLIHFYPLFLLGFFNIYLANATEIWGLQHMASSKVCLIYSLTPFAAALIAYIVLNEVLSFRKWVGMGIGFLGLAPIIFMQTSSEILSGTFWLFSLAEISIMIAVVSSVYGWVLLKKLITHYNYSFVFANGISMFLGSILILTHSYLSGESFNPLPVFEWQSFLFYTIVICVISNIICFNLYGFLLKHFSATFMAFAGLVSPFFASTYGWLFLNEIITWHFYVSILFFATGLTIFYLEEINTKYLFKKAKNKLAHV